MKNALDLCRFHACRMEEAFNTALQRAGGLAKAKPKGVHEKLQAEFPELTLQVRHGRSGCRGPGALGLVRNDGRTIS